MVRLRTQVAELQGRLDTRERRAARILMTRRVAAAVLIVIAAFGWVMSLVGLWGGRTLLNTNQFVATVAPLPQDPKVREATATYLTTAVFNAVDLEARLENRLPPRADFLAGPLTGRMRGIVHDTVIKVMKTPQFETLWVELSSPHPHGAGGQR